MAFLYRLGNIDDIEAVFRLGSAVLDEAWSRDVMLQSLQVGYDLFVCYQGKTLIAYVLSQDMLLETQIMQVCVHQDFRRQGVANKLMNMLIAAKQGMEALVLEVRVSNVAAQSLYRHLGFEIVGQRPNYYRQNQTRQREDALVMAYTITA